jgi:acetyl-CoA carboxylase carboxyl transferase subunit beta
VVVGVLDFRFLGGSMGEVVGEKIALAADLARTERLPLVLFTSSGGARMHEGMFSLMQMAKTCSALVSLTRAGGFSICVMTNPTTGGVTASFASVCDLTLAEPGALIGFAGPRVIASTIKQELPSGFQRAEFLLEHGQLDMIVPRKEMRAKLAALIDFGTSSWEGYAPLLIETGVTETGVTETDAGPTSAPESESTGTPAAGSPAEGATGAEESGAS